MGLLDSIKKKPSDNSLPSPPPFSEGPSLSAPPRPMPSFPTSVDMAVPKPKVMPNPPPAPQKIPAQSTQANNLLAPPPIFEETKPKPMQTPNIPKLPEIPPVPQFEIPKDATPEIPKTIPGPPAAPKMPAQMDFPKVQPQLKRPDPPKDFISHKSTITIESQSPHRELPSFPMRKEAPKDLPKIPDIEVPEPPPNLRSELSPLELEKLEKQYLGKRISVEDVESPYQYNRHDSIKKPLYVRTDDYRKMLDNFIDIKNLCTALDETVFRLENLKKNQDKELEDYKSTSEDVQRKLIYIDKTIFEGS